ncbi:unnamed protein product [Rhizoctonia solani]|uniref:Carboxylesterase type B domain-containing protein n=1 Tax=Rhizoctonia solani TaxID=456999 RepID=A0A8H2X766_9AGAM|nr:unnamed protein product [Rhizoctonia solani]
MFGACALKSVFSVLAHAQFVWGYALPFKRAGEVRVQANGTTYVGNQADAQDVFLGMIHHSSLAIHLTASYGGSFILGESQSYPGYGIVEKSIELGQPVLYVSMNYRLGFFGFPVGEQTMNKGAANLGLYDQRMAIEWVQNNIQHFGGDPTKISGDDFLPSSTSSIIESGKYANIPIISGSNLEEGTWFVAATSTFLDLVEFLNTSLPGLAIGLPPSISSPMCALYPKVLAEGSPYNTGNETFGRGDSYKWAASIVGDYLFTAPRRQFIRAVASRGQKVWSYMFSQPTAGAPPGYGISHTSEIAYVFGGLSSNATQESKDVSDKMMQYWINFATTLNPRPDGSNLPAWPTYGTLKNMVQLRADNYSALLDTFREPATDYILNTILG